MQALAQDQLRALLYMTKVLGVDFNIGIYDGDTSQKKRTELLDDSRLVTLYLKIFLSHTNFGWNEPHLAFLCCS